PRATFQAQKALVEAARDNLGSDADALRILSSYTRRGEAAVAAQEATGGVPDAELIRLATRYVRNNSAAGPRESGNALFPHATSGNIGVFSYALTGAEATRLAAVADTWFGDRAGLSSFDPDQQMVVAVRTTSDEETLHVSVLDKATGDGRYVGEMLMADYELSLPEEVFTRTVAPLDAFGAQYYDDIGHFEVVDALVRGGSVLHNGNPAAVDSTLSFNHGDFMCRKYAKTRLSRPSPATGCHRASEIASTSSRQRAPIRMRR
ncbi:hypothetical protein ACFL59_15375, partial [Planctomycetota bacterium]